MTFPVVYQPASCPASGPTAGEATYRLCDPTIRMDRMSVLPGVTR